MRIFNSLEVMMGERKVGTLASMKDGRVAFEYDEKWLVDGFSISPFSLPLEKKVFIPKPDPFEGLFGVFADSLPDGWGKLLVDRMLMREGVNPYAVDSLNRLAIIGDSGMGALSYRPIHQLGNEVMCVDYDYLADACRELLKTEYTEELDKLFSLGGSSGGARPKIYTVLDDEEWIVKFPSSIDRIDIGETEYRYSLCSKRCGIEMTDTKLFPSKKCAGYFGTKRFDRKGGKGELKDRVHMVSVSGILETSHRIPNLDYHLLMKLTLSLTKDYSQVERLYRQMCFNVFAHNRDDHSKNFSFLYSGEQGGWTLSPAYDLTYSNSIGGEHATCIDGNGRNPGHKEVLRVAQTIGLDRERARSIALEIEEIVNTDLSDLL